MTVLLQVPRPCSAEAAELGEGTRWDGARGELLWVDILAGCLRCALWRDGRLETIDERRLEVPVGAAAPLADGTGWLLAAGDGIAALTRDGALRWLAHPEARSAGATRMNDAACDPEGRFWAGSMAYDNTPGAGSLYRLDVDGECQTMRTGCTVSNGLGWSPDGTVMYHADSGRGTIDAFAFDRATGELGARRRLVHMDPAESAPDGLCVDDHGFIWTAIWEGGAVHRYSPDGELAEVVRLPVPKVTCCCFGGERRSTLFISTARLSSDEPDAGRVFAAETAVTGPAAFPARYAGPANALR